MSRTERQAELAAFDRRETQVLVCCELLIEGWDCTHVSAVVIARPTLIRYRYAQMVGRGLRICPEIGKTDCLIVDFDWQTEGARDLMTPVELFAFEDPGLLALETQARARVIAEARKLAEAGKASQEALEEAKEHERRRQSLPVYLSGIKAEFEVEVSDPLNVAHAAGISLKTRSDFAGGRHEAARAYQIDKLRRLGVHDAQKLSFYGASKLLKRLEWRKDQGLASHQQVNALLSAGLGEIAARAMSATLASRTLKELGR